MDGGAGRLARVLIACGLAGVGAGDAEAPQSDPALAEVEPDAREAPCGRYPDPSTSGYVLPYPPGVAPLLAQGNCGCCTHQAGGKHEYAYDFLMPIGTSVVASREGLVVDLEERFADGNHRHGAHNHVHVEHADSTVARDLHLTRGGALVAIGDRVSQGTPIGRSGNTGWSSEPHLHFEVVRRAGDGWVSIPVSFGNTRHHERGLEEGEVYMARPVDAGD